MDQELAVVLDGNPEEKVMVNPAVLILASPVFKSMLTQDMAEKERGVIELKGKDPEEFKVLMSFLMPASSRQQKITQENVDFLLRWTDEYCIESIRAECVDFVKKLPPTVDRVLQAHTFGMKDHFDFCVRQLLEKGQTDWGPCREDAKLLKILFDRFTDFNRDRTKEVTELRTRLKRGHVHTGGVLQDGHRMECAKCHQSQVTYQAWQCWKCRYSA